MLIFVDDERNPLDVKWVKPSQPYSDEWVVVRNDTHFMKALQRCNFIPECISFDHDLGLRINGSEVTGYNLLQFFVDRLAIMVENGDVTVEQVKEIEILAHSKNPVGSKNIEAYWKSFIQFLDRKY